MKIQTSLIHLVVMASVVIFVLYLGFMTEYYVLFYEGTDEMYELYLKLQLFNKGAFDVALQIVLMTAILMTFQFAKYRPGLLGLIYVFCMTIYTILRSLPLVEELIRFKEEYLAFDFTVMEDYRVSTLAFDIGSIIHYVQVGLLVVLCIVAVMTFIQRRKDGHPLIRKFI